MDEDTDGSCEAGKRLLALVHIDGMLGSKDVLKGCLDHGRALGDHFTGAGCGGGSGKCGSWCRTCIKRRDIVQREDHVAELFAGSGVDVCRMSNLSANGRCGILGQASAKSDCAGRVTAVLPAGRRTAMLIAPTERNARRSNGG